jgi:hypothetical protein
MKFASAKTLRMAALVAQWRAPAEVKAQIKAARMSRTVETIEPLIRTFVTPQELKTLAKRGCIHFVDFPEKRSASLRCSEETN